MDVQIYRAFDTVFAVNSHKAGELYTHKVENPLFTLICLEGEEKFDNKTTGEKGIDFSAGALVTPQNAVRGELDVTVVADTVLLCYVPDLNKGAQKQFEVVQLGQGQTQTLKQGSKFLVGSGVCVVNGKDFTGLAPVLIQSGDTTIIAKTNMVGVLIP